MMVGLFVLAWYALAVLIFVIIFSSFSVRQIRYHAKSIALPKRKKAPEIPLDVLLRMNRADWVTAEINSMIDWESRLHEQLGLPYRAPMKLPRLAVGSLDRQNYSDTDIDAITVPSLDSHITKMALGRKEERIHERAAVDATVRNMPGRLKSSEDKVLDLYSLLVEPTTATAAAASRSRQKAREMPKSIPYWEES